MSDGRRMGDVTANETTYVTVVRTTVEYVVVPLDLSAGDNVFDKCAELVQWFRTEPPHPRSWRTVDVSYTWSGAERPKPSDEVIMKRLRPAG